MKYYIYTILIYLLFFFTSCSNNSFNNVAIKEVYQTIRNEEDNVDSPAFWRKGNDEFWLISTCKGSHSLLVDDASTGKNIKKIGKLGNELGEFSRPNGIFIIDSLLFVVERDNHRIQVLTLPEFQPIATLGDSLLIKPYGIFVNKLDNSLYNIYITDNYETDIGKTPDDSLLNHRVHIYQFSYSNEQSEKKLLKTFGDTLGIGVLHIVESVWGDPENNIILFSEEDTSQSSLKVYDLDGNFLNKTFGEKLFLGQVEGITLYECSNNKGIWIVTDQSHQKNRFLLFDRNSFKYLGSFNGENTTNTDGIWLEQRPFGNFSMGAFFAVNNDGNVSAFDFYEILSKLKLENYCK